MHNTHTHKRIPSREHHDWNIVERIAIKDNQEPLLAVPNESRLKQEPIYFKNQVPHAINLCAARASVIEKLREATTHLPEHLGIVVLDAWRSREVQQALQDQIGDVIKQTYPHLSAEEQTAMLKQFVAPVGPDFVSPHLTGGSVDVTLFDLNSGAYLDMGSDFDEPTDKSFTTAYENQPEHVAHANRRTLYHAMLSVGFTNITSEWWHYDYGNQLWAHYSGCPHAVYGAAEQR